MSVNETYLSTTGDITLILAGDTNLQFRENPAGAFQHVVPLFRRADVRFVNLEGPLAGPSEDPGAPDIPHKAGWRHSEPRMVTGLVAAGTNVVGCANNVTYPPSALLRSLAVLDDAGIAHCGGGRNRDSAREPVIFERKGVRFGFLSYTSVFWPVGHAAGRDAAGVATIKAHTAYQPHPRIGEMPGGPPAVITWPDAEELASMREDVQRLRQRTDVVVLSCHWGVSGSTQTCEYQRAIGRAAIQAGADVVIGHGPHVLHGIELIGGPRGARPIFYSLGNFAFDWTSMRGKSLEGLLVRCTIREQRVVEVAFIPVQRNAQNDPVPLDPAAREGQAVVDQVRRHSAPYGTTFCVAHGEVAIGGVGA